ncbi:MAG: hypothetical protein L6R41_001287 [Letrouitia leprolyta]|nr:MAG: hypothetical protein L6R41_001287 [Letrouitia leprolyta]
MAKDSSNDGDEYILNRDWRAVARLHHRHMLFKIVRGYLLHPAVTLKPGAKIAEIGAGTCIWPIDVSRELRIPISVDAVDISMAQCPPPSWLPKNVRLVTHDVYQPFPSEMHGTYDMVHVQNWLCIWRTETSKTLIRNLLDLLRPGGFIQWSEQDPTANRIVVAPDAPTSSRFTEEIMSFLNNPRQTINFEWVSKLGENLSQQAKLVAFDRYSSLDEHQLIWSIGVLQACEEFGSNLERNARNEEDIERAKKLQSAAEGASAEMLNGVGIYSELVTAVAQKDATSLPSEDSRSSL